MIKNNKGFSLVELLGAIVVLGIISVFAIPQLINMVEKNRNKMYISDAKKLISKTEYKIRSNNSQIEMPGRNNCIVISLSYLDEGEFDAAPNGGVYESGKSFVVIRNYNSKLEYYVTIVEKYKGSGYKGVELTRDDILISKNALNHVVIFEDDFIDINNININSTGSLILYLNRRNLYCNMIENIYK